MLKVSDKESAFGALSKYANPTLIPFESCTWERSVIKPVKKIDCIIAAYHDVNKIAVFTFDKKLNNQLKREEK